MNKFYIIAICGRAGAGKDTLLQEVMGIKGANKVLHEIVSCTTRPPREGEINGVNYHFMSNEEFAQKVLSYEMLETTIFNDWCYGTSLQGLDEYKINIGVFNPEGIEALKEDPRINLKVYYVTASAKTRLIRQLNRESDPDVNEIIRRYKTDEEDFAQLNFNYDLVLNNNDNTKNPMLSTALEIYSYASNLICAIGQD